MNRAGMDKIATAPTVIDRHGRAWKMDLNAARALREVPPEMDATVAGWIIEAPWAHPCWHSYLLCCIHLRQIPGAAAARIKLPGATHEVAVLALDPDGSRQKLIDAGGAIGSDTCQYLTPPNFIGQFIAESDDAAAARIEESARQIVAGQLNPDTDYIRTWMYLYGDAMVKDPATAGQTRLIVGDTEIVIPAQPGPQDKH